MFPPDDLWISSDPEQKDGKYFLPWCGRWAMCLLLMTFGLVLMLNELCCYIAIVSRYLAD